MSKKKTDSKRRVQTHRRRVVIDAAGRSLGRVAAEAARVLQGKNRPDYLRNLDMGCWVHVINLSQSTFTGRKIDQKVYYRYSGYPGGITTRSLKNLWEKKPEFILRRTIYHMLPTNTLRKTWIKRLTAVN